MAQKAAYPGFVVTGDGRLHKRSSSLHAAAALQDAVGKTVLGHQESGDDTNKCGHQTTDASRDWIDDLSGHVDYDRFTGGSWKRIRNNLN